MAIVLTSLTPGINSTTDGDSFTPASDISPADGLLFVAVNVDANTNGDLRAMTPTWNGTGSPTMTQLRSKVWNPASGTGSRRAEVWYTKAVGMGTGRFLFDYGAGNDFQGCEAHFINVTGSKVTGTNGVNGIVQSSVGFSDTSVTSVAAGDTPPTLSAFADPVNNACLMFLWHVGNEASTVGAGMTALTNGAGHATPNGTLLSQYQIGQNLAPGGSYTTSSRYCAFAIEIAVNAVEYSLVMASGSYALTGNAASFLYTPGNDPGIGIGRNAYGLRNRRPAAIFGR